MTNKANSKLLFLRHNLKGCPEKLKQTAYFSLIRSFMEYGATVWDPYQRYNSDKVERVQRRAARFVKSRYSRYSSVSDMLDVLGWTPLSQMRQEARIILFYKIINGLAQVPFEGGLVEAYKGTRRKHNMKFRQIGHITIASMDSRFSLKQLVHGTALLSLKLRHWLYLDQIFFKISVHPFCIITWGGGVLRNIESEDRLGNHITKLLSIFLMLMFSLQWVNTIMTQSD